MATRKTSAAEKPAEEKKTDVKKAPAKKAAPAAKKAPVKKAAAPAANKAAEKVVTKVQFGGDEFDVNEIVEKVKAAYKAENKAAIKSVSVYIKPEDKAAYYVVNDKVEGKVDL